VLLRKRPGRGVTAPAFFVSQWVGKPNIRGTIRGTRRMGMLGGEGMPYGIVGIVVIVILVILVLQLL
jgi:hypothetical protein